MKKRMYPGQATLEYLLVLTFVAIIGVRLVGGLSNFLGDNFGDLASVISSHLTVGVCERFCFFGDYENGFTPTPGGN